MEANIGQGPVVGHPQKRKNTALAVGLLGLIVAGTIGCGGASRARAPQPQVGTAQLTAADLGRRVQKVLVADKEAIAMVGRDGCHATVRQGNVQNIGPSDELRVRCPRKERLTQWFKGLDRVLSTIEVAEVGDEDDDADDGGPAAQLVVGKGKVVKVVKAADAARLVAEVRAFGAELESGEIPHPGPATSSGWQMLRVTGAAHVMLGGEPTRGVLDARMSTNGQYFCEFVGATDEGSVRATKSGWITDSLAARALDEVLSPFQVQSTAESPSATFAAATTGGAERRANQASTAAVFERFAPLQDALGDACLPELEPPGANAGL